MRWQIVRRSRRTGREIVLGYADTAAGADEATPRDTRSYVHSVVAPVVPRPPDERLVVTNTTYRPDQLVDVVSGWTGFRHRGRVRFWNHAGLVLETVRGGETELRTFWGTEVGHVVRVEP